MDDDVGDGHAVDPTENLSRSRDQQVGIRLPIAVNARLDDLVDAAFEVGEKASRKELIAALITSCPRDPLALAAAVQRYRTMKVRDALPLGIADAAVVVLADHKPGPRSR